MKKAEIDGKFDEIVAFSEVERFLDTPLKHYSSGMQMRLAFAVAAHLEPEILLVDEVLAVGDLAFQKKCLGKMGDVARTGRTIVFVSHQMTQIRRLCERAIWVDGGKIIRSGPTEAVAAEYETAAISGGSGEDRRSTNAKARFVRWEIADARAAERHTLRTQGEVAVKFVIDVRQPIRSAHHGIALRNSDNQLIWGMTTDHLELEAGEQELSYTFPSLPVRPGTYSWLVTLYENGNQVDAWDCMPPMIVGTEDFQHSREEWNGVLNMPCEFAVLERARVGR